MPLAIRPARVDDAADLSALVVRAIHRSNAADYPADVIAHLLARHTANAAALQRDGADEALALAREKNAPCGDHRRDVWPRCR